MGGGGGGWRRVRVFLMSHHKLIRDGWSAPSGYDHDKNIAIGARAVDALLFDTNGPESSSHLYLRFLSSGVDKPMVDVETFGAWTNRFTPQGVFPAGGETDLWARD